MKFVFQVIISLIVFSQIFSCASYKESRTDKYFQNWKSKVINMHNYAINKNGIVQNLIDLELCINDTEANTLKKHFPKLEFFIVQEKVLTYTLTILPKYGIELFIPEESSHFKLNSKRIIKNIPLCTQSGLFPLVAFNKYKRKTTGKLKYGFGVLSEGKNINTAKALLDSHHSVIDYNIPKRISKILLNDSQNTALVYTSTTYESSIKRYRRNDSGWEFDKLIYAEME